MLPAINTSCVVVRTSPNGTRIRQQVAVPQKLAICKSQSALHKGPHPWDVVYGFVVIAVLLLPYTEKDFPPRSPNSFKSLLITLL